ncbi:hypothetical protein QEN19_002654 [Hanseniaspora menglaensis]
MSEKKEKDETVTKSDMQGLPVSAESEFSKNVGNLLKDKVRSDIQKQFDIAKSLKNDYAKISLKIQNIDKHIADLKEAKVTDESKFLAQEKKIEVIDEVQTSFRNSIKDQNFSNQINEFDKKLEKLNLDIINQIKQLENDNINSLKINTEKNNALENNLNKMEESIIQKNQDLNKLVDKTNTDMMTYCTNQIKLSIQSFNENQIKALNRQFEEQKKEIESLKNSNQKLEQTLKDLVKPKPLNNEITDKIKKIENDMKKFATNFSLLEKSRTNDNENLKVMLTKTFVSKIKSFQTSKDESILKLERTVDNFSEKITDLERKIFDNNNKRENVLTHKNESNNKSKDVPVNDCNSANINTEEKLGSHLVIKDYGSISNEKTAIEDQIEESTTTILKSKESYEKTDSLNKKEELSEINDLAAEVSNEFEILKKTSMENERNFEKVQPQKEMQLNTVINNIENKKEEINKNNGKKVDGKEILTVLNFQIEETFTDITSLNSKKIENLQVGLTDALYLGTTAVPSECEDAVNIINVDTIEKSSTRDCTERNETVSSFNKALIIILCLSALLGHHIYKQTK